jgi:arabinose-5-phosphate isomerase
MITGNKLPLIGCKKNLGEALKVMNQKKLGIVIVLNNKYVAGLVTDGDLRREIKILSKKMNLQKFMTKKPLVVNENMPASKALAIMNEKKITSLLVVSDNDLNKKNKIKLKGIIHIHSLLEFGVK